MDRRLFFPATQRNKKDIGDVLSRIPLNKGSILEVGSGSGEHAIEFQKRFPDIIWQASDPERIHRESISSWINHEELHTKMPEPLGIDVRVSPWEIPSELRDSLQGIISINMIHIASWECTKSLFQESGRLLNNGQFLMIYGPFKIGNKHISQSNDLFDKSLKMKNRNWGVRNLEEVSAEGFKNSLMRENLIKMPSNNFAVIYRKFISK